MNNAEYDAFARLLDGDLPQGEATAEARVLSAFAAALESSAVAPRMESKAELRMALVEAAREQAAAPPLLARMRQSFDDTTSRWRYSMRAAAASGAAAMALSGGGVALAADRAMPGDPFYGVKLTLEDVRLAFIGDPVARAEQLFAYANQRLLEAEIAAEDGDMAAAERALAEADQSSRSAAGYIIRASQDRGDPGLLTLLDDFTVEHRKRLAALLPLLTGDAVTAAEDAMVGLRRISQRVAVLSGPCADCGTQPGTAPSGRGPKRDTAAPSDPDFDFADIPPASEPFAPCPCVPNTTTVDTGAGKANAGKKRADTADEPTSKPRDEAPTKPADKPDKPSDPGPGDDPGDGPGEGPGDDDPLPGLPEPGDDPVKDAEDVIDDVIDNVPSDLPIDDPPLPLPSSLPVPLPLP